VDATRFRFVALRHRWLQCAAVCAVILWAVVVGLSLVGHDAITYLAAGERLNAGHPLYTLSPGDPFIDTLPPYYGPLLSPPLVAVLFRPIALAGLAGVWTWTIVAGLAVIFAAWYIAGSVAGSISVLALSFGLGIAAISGNVSSVFLLCYLAIWRWRDRPVIGVLIGVMAVAKLLPLVFVGFLVAGRRWQAIGWFVAALAAALVVSAFGAGLDNAVAYFGVARDALPQPISLGWATGLQ
jgi:Glycosyltransferase family 87